MLQSQKYLSVIKNHILSIRNLIQKKMDVIRKTEPELAYKQSFEKLETFLKSYKSLTVFYKKLIPYFMLLSTDLKQYANWYIDKGFNKQ
jgi:hypothetical protein